MMLSVAGLNVDEPFSMVPKNSGAAPLCSSRVRVFCRDTTNYRHADWILFVVCTRKVSSGIKTRTLPKCGEECGTRKSADLGKQLRA